MRNDLAREIQRFAKQHKIAMDEHQMQRIAEKCAKKLDKAFEKEMKSIIGEEVESFMIDREDAELV